MSSGSQAQYSETSRTKYFCEFIVLAVEEAPSSVNASPQPAAAECEKARAAEDPVACQAVRGVSAQFERRRGSI